MIHQVEHVTGESRDVRSLRDDQGMTTVAACIRAEDTVMMLKRFKRVVPDGMAGSPAMKEDERQTAAGDA